ncbi:MAG: hypothetical protein ACRD3H_17470 [Terriglobales bacterium]
MSARYLKATLMQAVVLALLWSGNTVSAAQQQHPARKHAAKPEAAPPPSPPAPPPPPPTLEQMPAVPPKVSFSNGLLTIVAENSTLADILRAVRNKTGAVVEMPPNATERVVTHLGPGPARTVLASLLNGSHFNYVMLGSPNNPEKVDRVILTSKAGAMPTGGTTPPPASTPSEATVAAPAMDEAEPPPVDASEQPAEDGGENSAQDNQPESPNGTPPVKTPEQMLRELQQQQLQQQQQQQQQQQPQNPPPQ